MSLTFIFGSNRDNIESCRRNSRIGKGFSRNHVHEYIFYVSDKLGADIYHCRCNGYCCHRFAIFVISEAKRQVYQRNSWTTCCFYRSAGGGGWGGGVYLVCNRIIIKKIIAENWNSTKVLKLGYRNVGRNLLMFYSFCLMN